MREVGGALAVEAVSEGRNHDEVCHGEHSGNLEKSGGAGDVAPSRAPSLRSH